ncbi:HEAT repeat protein [Actinoplanes campanulatus]|uniref:HEAT repeat protein n=1 Tax=Actinoplanes campanulatus TaxID=113559 RepID=A0A7W5AF33_9ACTN|nr:hypothetical protein [Actinoplanes campanulatus]MBB3094845.1 HEAT repeat protein [Actinoplanes campanulatus]GGN07784.1 hypothetical protein GCM10010109_16320 [Actinoplanes campanulatus]GID36139.1 hypothetical protein Aca09nite_26450 [Actinoplanes campanulatus]
MLNGIDDIDWFALDGAYGPCTEAPDILRAIASPDPEKAGEGRYDFFSSIWHQNTVYPVTAEVIPFLVELAGTPGVHQRDHLLHALGSLCDPDQVNGEARNLVRASVAVHSGPLLPLLTDPDPEIRAQAAYAAAWSGPHFTDALRERWAVETHPAVRAMLLPGLAMLDPVAAGPLLDDALHDPAPQVRAAAAVALTRTGQPLPDGALEAVGSAFAEANPYENAWSGQHPGWQLVFRAAGTASARVLAARMAAATDPEARVRLAHILADRFHGSRSAAADLLPVVRDLFTDPDPKVRDAAGFAVLAAGEAAAPLADVLIADGGHDALDVLVRLGHPGYAPLLLAAWAAGESPRVLDTFTHPEPPPFDPAVLTAIRERLARPPARHSSLFAASMAGDPVGDLLHVLRSWGPAAAGAVPEIVACLPHHPAAAAPALAAILPTTLPATDPTAFSEVSPAANPVALAAIPALTARAEAGDVRCGHAVLRLTGDAAPLVTAAAHLLGTDSGSAFELDLVADAGPAAAPLLPLLTRWFTGAAEPDHGQRRTQVAAARVAWRATGDTGPFLPTLRALVRAGFGPGGLAADLLTETGEGADLTHEIRRLLNSDWYARSRAARALHRLGVPAEDLVPALLTAVASGHRDAHDALNTLATIRAVTAVPALTTMADRDERHPASAPGDLSWNDDLFRRHLRTTIVALTPVTGR